MNDGALRNGGVAAAVTMLLTSSLCMPARLNAQAAASRWDEVIDLGEANAIQAVLQAHPFPTVPNPPSPTSVNQLQLDMEIPPLSPTDLRAQSWYPATGTVQSKAAFEKKYYDGFAMTQYAAVEAARQAGFSNISIYGWDPVSIRWGELSTYPADPSSDWYWQNVGVQLLSHVDLVTNSVYVPYWDPANVAFTLAQNDLNLAFVNSVPALQRKPVRPSFTHQITGGGNDSYRWWRDQGVQCHDQ